MNSQHVILGSASPRRRELFQAFSLPCEMASPQFDESSIPFEGNPETYVCQLSEGKGLSLLPDHPDSIILTADTIVFCNGKIYGKPKDRNDALQMLKELQGKWHTVYTGVTLTLNKKLHQSNFEATRVLFNSLSEKHLSAYLNHIEWADKAGAYAIQKGGGLLIKQIDGCYYNVMGLPINTLRNLFSSIGIDLWDYLR